MIKSGFIALVGRPNVGKSTLINALLNYKVSIISPKAQTTRNIIKGIYNDIDSQMIFLDTPGIHNAKHKLGINLNKMAKSQIKGVDIIYHIVDCSTQLDILDDYIFKMLKNIDAKVILIVNKIDKISKDELLVKLNNYNKLFNYQAIFPISAILDNNFDKLINNTKKFLDDSIIYYPIDKIVEYPQQFIISEIIREKVINFTNYEIPYSIAVVVEKLINKKDKIIIYAMILVERNSQKGIIIGKNGNMIKNIGLNAREELESIFGNKIYLELFVRVEQDWRNKDNKLKELGYHNNIDI